MNELPEFNSMSAAAIGLHETYASYVNAGFTADQAMQIILTMIAAAMGGATK